METESHSAVWTAGAAGAGVLPEKSGWAFLGRDEGWVPDSRWTDVPFSLVRV